MRVRILLATLAGALAAAGAAQAGNYLVLYQQPSVPADAAGTILAAGGQLVYAYDQIGVAVASSDDAHFARQLVLGDPNVDAVEATAPFAMRLPDATPAPAGPPEELPNAPATGTDPLSSLQWDMRQIKAPEAHAITGGSPAVLVGDIDTGMDFNHPDLKPNADVADSANCVSGVPVPGLAAQDDQGHGTHTAGTIAAAANGVGIVGVAPNVRIAAIKAGNADGYFFPESIVCAFVWAADHGVDVTNNSYFGDPYLYNCRNDPAQRAIWKAEERAIRYAMDKGVTVVAAEGNEAEDIAHPTYDVTSPDYPDGAAVERRVTNACVVIPVEIPGVIGVTGVSNQEQVDANGNPIGGYLKAYYSSFGVGSAAVTAPGGDYYWGRTPESANGLVLSTWPAYEGCTRRVTDPNDPTAVYCYLQGTSMASPHAAGVAALIVSRYGDLKNAKHGKMSPVAVAAYLRQTADPQPCPVFLPDSFNGIPYLAVTGANSGAVQSCQGGEGYNSWYGNGQVDALAAVTKSSGNH
jgi:subtilisin family serine protease